MASGSSSTPPVRPPVVHPGSGNSVIINPCQRLNPVLKCIRNVNKEFGDIVPDYVLGRTTCALFLSLKYHRLHPEYIHQRIEKLGNAYNLRILLLMCDVSEHQEPIRELTKVCLINNITIMMCWSVEEAGQYISLYKSLEHKPPDIIKERIDKDYDSILRAALTSINKINKVDVEMLRANFGSFANIAKATPEQLSLLPGIGPTKVRRLTEAFNKPFRSGRRATYTNVDRSSTTKTQQPTSSSRLHQPSADPSTAPSSSARKLPQGIINIDNDIDDFPDLLPELAPEPSSSRPRPRKARPEPDWNINFSDLNERPSGNDVSSTSKGKEKESLLDVPPRPTPRQHDTEQESIPSRRQRSPSPIWDIELDLN